jgi:hypothetical protein
MLNGSLNIPNTVYNADNVEFMDYALLWPFKFATNPIIYAVVGSSILIFALSVYNIHFFRARV